jgi:hypothetical protein
MSQNHDMGTSPNTTDMSSPPDEQTIRSWTRTLRTLRLVAALSGERMVQVLDRLVAAELRRVHDREQPPQ